MHAGLGLLEGHVTRLKPNGADFRVPNIGWCDVTATRQSTLFPNAKAGCYYHVHSYHFVPKLKSMTTGTIDYSGTPHVVAMEAETLWGSVSPGKKSGRRAARSGELLFGPSEIAGTALMARPRLIPVLLLKHGVLVRSQSFRTHQVIGNPMSTVERLSDWNVDELILLDISADDFHDLAARRHPATLPRDERRSMSLREIAKVCFMPLHSVGKIQRWTTFSNGLRRGRQGRHQYCGFDDPAFIEAASGRFGVQCIVVSIDALRHADGRLRGLRGGRQTTNRPRSCRMGARSRPAWRRGDLPQLDRPRRRRQRIRPRSDRRSVANAVEIPVIACGGVGRYEDFAAGITKGGASAVAAANIFHFFEHSYPRAKKACIDAGLPMRPVQLDSAWQLREPTYDRAAEDARIDDRLRRARRTTSPRNRGKTATPSAGARVASIRRSARRRWSSTIRASAWAVGWRR